jgi:hypothetical protein
LNLRAWEESLKRRPAAVMEPLRAPYLTRKQLPGKGIANCYGTVLWPVSLLEKECRSTTACDREAFAHRTSRLVRPGWSPAWTEYGSSASMSTAGRTPVLVVVQNGEQITKLLVKF